MDSSINRPYGLHSVADTYVRSGRRRRSSYRLRPYWLTFRKGLIVLLAVPVIVGATFGARLVSSLSHLTHQSVLSVIHDLVSGGGNSAVGQQLSGQQRINIALYGYGGPGHDGAYLSDSIMVVSVQPHPNGPPDVAEISLPRDWWVPINLGTTTSPQRTYSRINEAYADGMLGQSKQFGHSNSAGGQLANQTLEHLLGIHIDHYAGIDFYAFKDAVDAVGGVDVNVPNAFTDDQYPAGECNGQANQNCAFMTVHFNSGPQHMNGSQALIFSRSRHASGVEGTDFARSHRQQLIVAALKQRVVSAGGIGSLPGLLNALGDHVLTDMSVSDGEALYAAIKGVDPASIEHISLDDTNLLYDCGYPANCDAWVLYAADNTYKSLSHFMNNLFLPADVVSAKVPVTFEDASAKAGAASKRWAALAAQLGLKTTDGGVVRRQVSTQVINYGGGKGDATAQWLAQYFGVSVTSGPAATAPGTSAGYSPQATPTPPSSGVVVVLGTKEELAFNNRSGSGD